MKRTDIIALIASQTKNQTSYPVVICDPFVFSRSPEKAETGTVLASFFHKIGTDFQFGADGAGTHVEVEVDGEVKYVMPNMVIGLADAVGAKAAEATAKATAAKAKDAAATQEARDRMDALLAVLAATGIRPAASKDGKTATFTVDQLAQVAEILCPPAA